MASSIFVTAFTDMCGFFLLLGLRRESLTAATGWFTAIIAHLTATIPAVVDPTLWDPMPVTLPTYVTKPAARRTVRTIDLDSTGVWSSGRNDADSELAREADAQRARSEAEADVDERRALGS